MIRKIITRYYIGSDEVFKGDLIRFETIKTGAKFCTLQTTRDISIGVLDETSINFLKKIGILTEVHAVKYEEVPSFQEYINKALKIFTANWVEIPNSVVFELCAKAIAIDIDKNYPNHISESPRIYGISKLNGKIAAVPKEKIKNYNNFAAFRCEEDAELAVKILKPLLNRMYQ